VSLSLASTTALAFLTLMKRGATNVPVLSSLREAIVRVSNIPFFYRLQLDPYVVYSCSSGFVHSYSVYSACLKIDCVDKCVPPILGSTFMINCPMVNRLHCIESIWMIKHD
jgi:hypothetical protein